MIKWIFDRNEKLDLMNLGNFDLSNNYKVYLKHPNYIYINSKDVLDIRYWDIDS